jgi:hypothetical protein
MLQKTPVEKFIGLITFRRPICMVGGGVQYVELFIWFSR